MKIITESWNKFLKEYEEGNSPWAAEPEGDPLVIAANDALYELEMFLLENNPTPEMTHAKTTIADLMSKLERIKRLLNA